jgi:hypothetical protein
MSDNKQEVDKELEQLKEYFKKPETQEKVAALAIQFNNVFGFDWFTLNQCAEVFSEASVEQLIDIIRSLDLCGFMVINSKKSPERYRLSKNQFRRMVDGIGEE